MGLNENKAWGKIYILFIAFSILIIAFYLFALYRYTNYQSILYKQTATQNYLNSYSASIEQTQTYIAQLNYTPTPLPDDVLRETAVARLPGRLGKGLPPEEEFFQHTIGYESITMIQKKDKYLEVSTPDSKVRARDFIFEGIFINPSETGIPFDYGILFRNQSANTQYRLMIIPKKHQWELSYWNEDKGTIEENIDDGTFIGISPYENNKNKVRVIAYQNKGWLYINDGFVAEFTLLDNINGKISIATDMMNNQVLDGRKIKCEKIKIWWNE